MKKSREKGKKGRKKGRREKKKREATTKNRYRGIRTREDRLARTTPRIQSSASTRERERELSCLFREDIPVVRVICNTWKVVVRSTVSSSVITIIGFDHGGES